MGRLLHGAGWGWCAAALVILLLRWVDRTGPVPTIQALLPVSGWSLLVLLPAAVVGRTWRLAAASALLVIPYAVLAAPWVTGAPLRYAEADLVVVSANLLYGRADLAEVEAAVREHEADALVLLEVDPAAAATVAGGPLGELLPHASGGARSDAGGTLVLTADPHQPLEPPQGTPFDQVPVRVSSPTLGEWTLLGAHPFPPLPLDSGRWRADLRILTDWRAGQPDELPLVIAGDLNASASHPALRQVADGMADAHEVVGAGWVRTWAPAGRWVPGFVHLDHVLVRDLTVVDAGATELTGSDHDLVWARFRLG